jgi:GTP-binding protein
MDSDLMFLDWLKFYSRDFSVVLTKTDKAGQADISKGLAYLKENIGDFHYFLTSSHKKRGISKLCSFILSRATL